MRLRASLLAVLFVIRAAAANAQSLPAASTDPQKIESAAIRLHPILFDNHVIQELSPGVDDEHLVGTSRAGERSWGQGALSVGPFHLDIENGEAGRDGKQSHFARLRLDGVSVLGGDVSGTFNGRAATIRLSWPTGN